MDKKVLSYGDVLLRQEDLDILSGPFWLSDRLIEFYFQYLEKEGAPQDRMLLVGPSVSFWLANCTGFQDTLSTLASLKFRRKEVALFVINDNEDVDLPEGGSHWSLLVYLRASNSFSHFDSAGKSNSRAAEALVEKLLPLTGSKNLKLEPSPQQMNGHDCGVYVLAIARIVWRKYKAHPPFELSALSAVIKQTATQAFISQLRRDILENVKALRSEAEDDGSVC